MKNTNILLVVIVGLIGLLAGHYVWDNTQTVEVAGPTVYQNVTVEKEVPSFAAYLGQAKADFWNEVEDTEKLHFCNSHEYDFNDIVLSKVYTNYEVSHEDEDTYTVSFEAKLRYSEDGKNCFDNYKVSVLYDEDENPEVTVK